MNMCVQTLIVLETLLDSTDPTYVLRKWIIFLSLYSKWLLYLYLDGYRVIIYSNLLVSFIEYKTSLVNGNTYPLVLEQYLCQECHLQWQMVNNILPCQW